MDAPKFLLTGATLHELMASPEDGHDCFWEPSSSSASHQPSGFMVKQEYSLQTQWAASKQPGCTFYHNLSHYISILTIACPEGEVELKIEPSVFLSVVDNPEWSHHPYSTDSGFQPYFTKAWASYQANRTVKEKPHGKWATFDDR
ncbi:hypothetical protein PAXINDRAFT_18521 [Paxillus involutus ATCC 200175]|uniref:Unplaced genomic scaffold PAXINscaffold_323, whole genome shotgun sequence n=1 Tax=Paxillus involutus ATCC 200175 TaxID=664439 RepID=A0A0C9TLW2_PAXIN|nr:hypothetical protein PAXINDRAFT_18521 [Paxillus involutus ATCC 200175]